MNSGHLPGKELVYILTHELDTGHRVRFLSIEFLVIVICSMRWSLVHTIKNPR